MKLLEDYKQWKLDNPDEGYQYDQIHEFFAEHGRGDIQTLLETALEYKEKADKWDKLDRELFEMYEVSEYDEEYETSLLDVGETCAIAFGYL